MMNQKLILASQSPRRRELLAMITTDFEVQVADIDEKAIANELLQNNADKPFLALATQLVEELAKKKAEKIFALNPDSIVIGADTVVLDDHQILGKPADEADAYATLRSYFGKKHSVVTGVHIMTDTSQRTFSVKSEVEFCEWSEAIDKQVWTYIRSGSPMDKAGAYGIQDMPSIWIKEVSGNYSSIIGLPTSHVNQALITLGVHE